MLMISSPMDEMEESTSATFACEAGAEGEEWLARLRAACSVRSRVPGWLHGAVLLLLVVAYPLLPFAYVMRATVRWVRSMATRKRRLHLIAMAHDLRDPRAAGPLLLMLRHDNRYVREPLVAALCTLLPNVQRAAELPQEAHDVMTHALRYGPESELSLAALEAVGRWEDATPQNLFAVRSISMRQDASSHALQRRAREILPILERAAAQIEQKSVLLRASANDATPRGSLLRAAAGDGRHDAASLLRAQGTAGDAAGTARTAEEPALLQSLTVNPEIGDHR